MFFCEGTNVNLALRGRILFCVFFVTVFRLFQYTLTMSELSTTDAQLLKKIKSRIEEISGLNVNTEPTQKDFDFLLYYIEEKTGQKLSLTTVKRVWRDEFQRLPHLSTLNMFSQLAFGIDWLSLKKDFLEGQKNVETGAELQEISTHQSHDIGEQIAKDSGGNRHSRYYWIAGALIVASAITGFYWLSDPGLSANDISNVVFSAEATADFKIPNTVVFSYDVHAIPAHHIFLQQSWDSVKRIELSKTNTRQTDIYYEPGYHYATLIADDRVIKEIAVHIRYDDWYVRFRYPDSELVKIENSNLNRNDYLGVKPDYLATNPQRLTDDFQLGYMLSRDFGVSADGLQLSSSFKFDSISAPACPIMSLLVKGDKDYMWLDLGNKGCESNLGLKCGDRIVSGKVNDLSGLGTDIFSWQKLSVKIVNERVVIILNDKSVLETTYSNELGNLKEIDFFFNGIGSIDDVTLKDSNDKLTFADTFQ
jgi:hypothetical protein